MISGSGGVLGGVSWRISRCHVSIISVPPPGLTWASLPPHYCPTTCHLTILCMPVLPGGPPVHPTCHHLLPHAATHFPYLHHHLPPGSGRGHYAFHRPSLYHQVNGDLSIINLDQILSPVSLFWRSLGHLSYVISQMSMPPTVCCSATAVWATCAHPPEPPVGTPHHTGCASATWPRLLGLPIPCSDHTAHTCHPPGCMRMRPP